MKVKLESKEVKLRGVVLTSESDEEKLVLENLWCQAGRPVMLSRLPDGQKELILAPTPEGGVKTAANTLRCSAEILSTRRGGLHWSSRDSG